jgi:ATP synthase protein I
MMLAEHVENHPRETARRFWRTASLASVGIEMGVAVALGWWFGQWLDGKLGTAPWLMILFLLLGVAAAFKAVIRTAREVSRS